MIRVSYVFPTSHHYRLPFHERLRDRLAESNIEYTVIYCDPAAENIRRRDTVDILWGVKVRRITLFRRAVYQQAFLLCLKRDLVIIQQQNNLLLNYLLVAASAIGLLKIGYFGHGRNFQARNPDSLAELWKRFWAVRADWWFAYTNETRAHIITLGFPSDRITVFNNAVDTSEIHNLIAATSQAQIERRRQGLGITGHNTVIFIGGLYEDKRLAFMVEAGDRIRKMIGDFTLIVAGGGEQLPLLRQLAASRNWIKVTGPVFGPEKVELMLLSQLMLMPGLVGLAVVDAGAAALPTVTTAFPFHSPEIAYVEHSVNGLIVQDWKNPQAYADAVIALLSDSGKLAEMRGEAKRMAETLTIEAMADRFAAGVLQALKN